MTSHRVADAPAVTLGLWFEPLELLAANVALILTAPWIQPGRHLVEEDDLVIVDQCHEQPLTLDAGGKFAQGSDESASMIGFWVQGSDKR